MGRKEGIVAGIAVGAVLGMMAGFCLADFGGQHGEGRNKEAYQWNQASASVNTGWEQANVTKVSLADLKPFPEEGQIGKEVTHCRPVSVAQLPIRQMAGNVPSGLRLPLPKRPERNQVMDAAPKQNQTSDKENGSVPKESYSSQIAFVGGGSIDFASDDKQGE